MSAAPQPMAPAAPAPDLRRRAEDKRTARQMERLRAALLAEIARREGEAAKR